MIIILSPAKSLDFKKSGHKELVSIPEFGLQANIVAEEMLTVGCMVFCGHWI